MQQIWNIFLILHLPEHTIVDFSEIPWKGRIYDTMFFIQYA